MLLNSQDAKPDLVFNVKRRYQNLLTVIIGTVDPMPANPEEYRRVELVVVLDCLADFLRLTGPNVPPGFGTARDTQVWAMTHQQELVLACSRMCAVTYDENNSPIDFGLDLLLWGPEWTSRDQTPLLMLYDVFGKIVKRWGFAYTPETSYQWGEVSTRAMVPFGVKVPPALVVKLHFPLTITADEHEQLTWVLDQFKARFGSSEIAIEPPSRELPLPQLQTSPSPPVPLAEVATVKPRPTDTEPKGTSRPSPGLALDDRAVALFTGLVKKDQPITAASLARQLGVHRSSLYDAKVCPNFLALWRAHQAKPAQESKGRRKGRPYRDD
jgi:hypothetical protein